jgi:hypothetical protein
MRTLTNLDGVSLYLVANDEMLLVREDAAYIGNPLLIVSDMREGLSVVVEGVTPPADWKPGRYFLIDGEWSLNEEWQEPVIEVMPAPEAALQSVTMRQARLALLSYGLLDDVEAVIITMNEPQRSQTQIEWEYAQTVERDNALVAALGPALGLDDAAIDSLFTLAATL